MGPNLEVIVRKGWVGFKGGGEGLGWWGKNST